MCNDFEHRAVMNEYILRAVDELLKMQERCAEDSREIGIFADKQVDVSTSIIAGIGAITSTYMEEIK